MKTRILPCHPLPLVLAAWSLPAFAAGSAVIGENLLWLAIILFSARLFSPLTGRFGMPAVLGELLLGVALGNLGLIGWHYFDTVRQDPIIAFIAELGVIVLLLQIGLETRLKDLVEVGPRATLVAVVGIAFPFALGAMVAGPWLLGSDNSHTNLFLGATLAATSVGITGRVFRDLGQLGMREAKIVLGAAVIDDVLGLVLLAVVSGLVQAGSVSVGEVVGITATAAIFLAGSVGVGRWLSPHASRWLANLDAGPAMLFALVLATGLFLAWLAHAVGLAPIIGAFAAGLLFEPVFLRHFETPHIVREVAPLLDDLDRGHRMALTDLLLRHTQKQHEHMIEPIGYFFVPVFFVLTGMQVDLRAILDPQVLLTAIGISLLAIVGKLVAGFAAGRGISPWIIGWGMVPRGEVGLIFAMVGKQLGVIGETTFSVIVVMVILTTLITPPILTKLIHQNKT